jgi:hypothetical protein
LVAVRERLWARNEEAGQYLSMGFSLVGASGGKTYEISAKETGVDEVVSARGGGDLICTKVRGRKEGSEHQRTARKQGKGRKKRRTGGVVLLPIERETLDYLRRVDEEVLLRIASARGEEVRDRSDRSSRQGKKKRTNVSTMLAGGGFPPAAAAPALLAVAVLVLFAAVPAALPALP